MKAYKLYDNKFESNLDHKNQILLACNFYSYFFNYLLSVLIRPIIFPHS